MYVSSRIEVGPLLRESARARTFAFYFTIWIKYIYRTQLLTRAFTHDITVGANHMDRMSSRTYKDFKTVVQVVVLLLCHRVHNVHGHGAVVHPPPRNAIDGQLPRWQAGVPYPPPFGGWCPVWQVSG